MYAHKFNNAIQRYPGNYGVKIGIIKELRNDDKRTGEYPFITKFKSYEDVKLSKGLKKFEVNGQVLVALNKKNAIRKYKNQINK